MINVVKEAERWNIGAVSRTLGCAPRSLDDPANGEGFRFDLQGAQATLELFPQTLSARYRSPLTYLEMSEARMELRGQRSGDGSLRLISEDERTRAVLQIYRPDGTLLFVGPKEAREPAEDEWTTVTGRVSGEPKLSRTRSGKALLDVLLAEETAGKPVEWHRVKFWNERAETYVKELHRGQEVAVSGFRKEEIITAVKGALASSRLVSYIHGVKVEVRQ